MDEKNVNRKRVWEKPNNVWFFFKQTEYKYAKKMMETGNIKFNCAKTWVDIAKKKGQGQGDLYEGVFATCSPLDISTALSFHKRYDDVESEFIGGTVYFRRKSVMELPVFCFYALKNGVFEVPQREGRQNFKATVPASYFKDFANNITKEQIDKLNEDQLPTIVIINDKLKFIDMIKEKLISMGAKESEILCELIAYDFDFKNNKKFRFNCKYESPQELFIKDKSFIHQSECRIVVNTKNKLLIEMLKEPIDIGPINDIAYISTTYFEEGMDIVLNADSFIV